MRYIGYRGWAASAGGISLALKGYGTLDLVFGNGNSASGTDNVVEAGLVAGEGEGGWVEWKGGRGGRLGGRGERLGGWGGDRGWTEVTRTHSRTLLVEWQRANPESENTERQPSMGRSRRQTAHTT